MSVQNVEIRDWGDVSADLTVVYSPKRMAEARSVGALGSGGVVAVCDCLLCRDFRHSKRGVAAARPQTRAKTGDRHRRKRLPEPVPAFRPSRSPFFAGAVSRNRH
jgi:hypothetical protein